MEMVVGVRFRNVGKIYYFNPKDYKVKVGDHVIVETARGVEYGRVVLEPRAVKEDEVVHPLKEVLRVATKEDEEHEAENRLKEKDAFKICKKKIREHGLEMKLIDAEALNASIFFSLRIFSKIRSPSCFILVTRNPPFVFMQKLLYSSFLIILYRSFTVKSLYVLIGKFRFFQFSKLGIVSFFTIISLKLVLLSH